MKDAAGWIKFLVLVVMLAGIGHQAAANDLPLAAASPLTGVAFDDRPLLLPVQRNFQMAMLTAGSELGRSCGRMEAYGWRMSQTEQGRVNQIFNNTVDRMRMMGYTIAPQNLTSVSRDITLFTADNKDRHFIFLWSAGELGLVMTLCETTAPLASTYHPALTAAPSVQTFPVPMDVVSSRLDAPGRMPTKAADDDFTPLGEWVGGYTCAQGYTGGSLQITHLKGQDFEGVFKFYPTPKNPTVLAGAYGVYGQYDRDSHRILINPGKWIQRPRNYYNTVIVGSFDPLKPSFSAYFQGVSGCTSFEARRVGEPYPDFGASKKHKKTKPAVKRIAKKKQTVVKPVAAPASAAASAPLAPPVVSPPPAASAPPAAPSAPTIVSPTPIPAAPVAPAAPPVAAPPSVAPSPPATAPAGGLAIPPAPAATISPPTMAAPAATPPATPDDKKPQEGIVLSAPAPAK